MRDLSHIAVSMEFRDLDLQALSRGELDHLSRLVAQMWAKVDPDADDALTLRFEWLMPMIDAELRHRTAPAP